MQLTTKDLEWIADQADELGSIGIGTSFREFANRVKVLLLDHAQLRTQSMVGTIGPSIAPISRHTISKSETIMQHGFECSGYVLLDSKTGERRIVELGAVRSLTNQEMWDLMHHAPVTE